MTDQTTDRIVSTAATIAMKAAVDYCARNGVELTPDRINALVDALRRHVKAAFDEAIQGAREAIEARMDVIASATFAASMRLAGIDAAKEVAR